MKIFVFQKEISLFRGETREIVFTPEEFPQLKIDNPRLWWPLFKGKPDLYELKMTVSVKGQVSDSFWYSRNYIGSEYTRQIPSVLCQWQEDLYPGNELDTGRNVAAFG